MANPRLAQTNSKQSYTDDQVEFDKKAYELGITSSVFPHGKSTCRTQSDIRKIGITCDDEKCGCFQDKLREFVNYQMPQMYMDTNWDLGIPLSSTEGKSIFKEAVHSDFMECYYTISQHIDNQEENACSTAALLAALNSLGIDPAFATWYGEFRWHHLGSLSCCTPVLQSCNFTLHQLCCLAVCNDMLAFPVHVEDDWTLDRVRDWVKLATSRSDVVMIANYGREAINQIGIGHHLPICGYHEDKDMVLLMETAKHKYQAGWLPLHHLMAAMNDRDKSRDGDNRGFAILTRPDYDPSKRLFGPSLSLRLDALPGQVTAGLKSFMTNWNKWLNTEISHSSPANDVLSTTTQAFIASLRDNSDPTLQVSLMTLTLVHFHCHRDSSIIARCTKPHNSSFCHNALFLQQLESLEIFKKIQTYTSRLGDKERNRILDLVVCDLKGVDEATAFIKSKKSIRPAQYKGLSSFLKTEKLNEENKIIDGQRIERNGQHDYFECSGHVEFLPEHILTFLLLSWPYCAENVNTVAALRKYMLCDAKFDFTRQVEDVSTMSFVSEAMKTLEMDADVAIDLRQNSGVSIVIDDFENLRDRKISPNGVCDVNECLRNYSGVTACNALEEIMKSQFLQMSNLWILNDHVKAMKRKINVILQFHELL